MDKPNKTIAIDAMGGDYGPSVTVPAALNILSEHPNISIILVGDEDELRKLSKKIPSENKSRLKIKHTTEVVGSDEAPSSALRGKKDSSLRVSVNLIKEGEADACISAGNTGALMATARFVLKMMKGIDRPAITAAMPTDSNSEVYFMDLGANVECSADNLYQFAIMGSTLSSALEGIENPRVALLNIGEEEIKGKDSIKLAAEMLQANEHINYIGFVEGDGIFNGSADVVVTDGFTGNSVLKSLEGLTKMISRGIKKTFHETFLSRLAGGLCLPVLNRMRDRMDPGRRNGATLLGVNGIVVKSHGGARRRSFQFALERTVKEVEMDVPRLISRRVEEILEQDVVKKADDGPAEGNKA